MAEEDVTAAMDAAEAAARKLASWMGYGWDGLNDGSIVEKGFPVFTFNQFGGRRFQGYKGDLINFARELLAAAIAHREAEAVPKAHPLEVYADSYAQMARMGDGTVDCRSVEVDIRQNMILVTQSLVAPPAQEPDFATAIAEVIKEESANGAACGWLSCTGCHETNEGAETGHYPYSKMFGCYVGAGCGECGGLGVVWDYWGKEALDEMQRDAATPPERAVEVTDAMADAALLRSQDKDLSTLTNTAAMREIIIAALAKEGQANG